MLDRLKVEVREMRSALVLCRQNPTHQFSIHAFNHLDRVEKVLRDMTSLLDDHEPIVAPDCSE
jgi:hypothetical protein